jgi:hypothetical protein
MARLLISCINKTVHSDPHQRIRNVGGIHNGSRWKHTENEAISNIERQVHTYHVNQGGRDVNVIIATHNGNKYLKTENDGLHPNNLLSLSECP